MMTKTTAEEIYSQVVKPLPPSERFKLATMILNNISPRAVVDYGEEWTEEDMRDLTIYSLRYATQSFGEEEEGEDAKRQPGEWTDKNQIHAAFDQRE